VPISSKQWFTQSQRSETEYQFHFFDGFGRACQTNIKKNSLAHFCTCKYTKSCIHIALSLEFLSTNQTQDDPPIQIIGDINKQTAEANKVKRSEKRVAQLEDGLDDLQLWVDDMFSQGLATQIQSNKKFAESIAQRMSDAGLGALHKRLQNLQAKTVSALTNNHPLPIEWADLLMLMRAAAQSDKIPEPLWNDLTQELGITLRKDAVKEQSEQKKEPFMVLHVEYKYPEPRLQERTTWYYGHKTHGIYAHIEFEFEGSGMYLGPDEHAKTNFEATYWLYPSMAPLRIVLAERPEQKHYFNAPNLRLNNSLELAFKQYTSALKLKPWLTEWPVLIQNAHIYYADNQFFIQDSDHFRSVLTATDLPEKRDALWLACTRSLEDAQDVFCMASAAGFRYMGIV
jgi:hypothetical protein